MATLSKQALIDANSKLGLKMSMTKDAILAAIKINEKKAKVSTEPKGRQSPEPR